MKYIIIVCVLGFFGYEMYHMGYTAATHPTKHTFTVSI